MLVWWFQRWPEINRKKRSLEFGKKHTNPVAIVNDVLRLPPDGLLVKCV